jgi:hypothetical protein
MNKPNTKLSPDQLFAKAINQAGADLSEGGFRLLTSGLTALCEAQQKHLNEIELKAINGMTAYVAYSQEANQETVTAILKSNLGVEEMNLLPSKRYDEAMEFLINLEMTKIVN